MSWIKTVSDDEATGVLSSMYAAARARAGRVFNILRVMSPNPPAARSAMGVYRTLMFGESPLSRAQRELLAVVVSDANRCEY